MSFGVISICTTLMSALGTALNQKNRYICVNINISEGNNTYNWYDAKDYCMRHFGSSLASIHSHDDFNHLQSLIHTGNGYADSWIGLNDIESTCNYQWSDGSINDYMINWRHEDNFVEPNHSYNKQYKDEQHCAAYHINFQCFIDSFCQFDTYNQFCCNANGYWRPIFMIQMSNNSIDIINENHNDSYNYENLYHFWKFGKPNFDNIKDDNDFVENNMFNLSMIENGQSNVTVYRSIMIDDSNYWNHSNFNNSHNFTQIRLTLYKNKKLQQYFTFKLNTNNVDWFSNVTYIDSSYSDIITKLNDITFNINDNQYNRYFAIYLTQQTNIGWIAIENEHNSNNNNNNTILYSNNWRLNDVFDSMANADMFVVSLGNQNYDNNNYNYQINLNSTNNSININNNNSTTQNNNYKSSNNRNVFIDFGAVLSFVVFLLCVYVACVVVFIKKQSQCTPPTPTPTPTTHVTKDLTFLQCCLCMVCIWLILLFSIWFNDKYDGNTNSDANFDQEIILVEQILQPVSIVSGIILSLLLIILNRVEQFLNLLKNNLSKCLSSFIRICQLLLSIFLLLFVITNEFLIEWYYYSVYSNNYKVPGVDTRDWENLSAGQKISDLEYATFPCLFIFVFIVKPTIYNSLSIILIPNNNSNTNDIQNSDNYNSNNIDSNTTNNKSDHLVVVLVSSAFVWFWMFEWYLYQLWDETYVFLQSLCVGYVLIYPAAFFLLIIANKHTYLDSVWDSNGIGYYNNLSDNNQIRCSNHSRYTNTNSASRSLSHETETKTNTNQVQSYDVKNTIEYKNNYNCNSDYDTRTVSTCDSMNIHLDNKDYDQYINLTEIKDEKCDQDRAVNNNSHIVSYIDLNCGNVHYENSNNINFSNNNDNNNIIHMMKDYSKPFEIYLKLFLIVGWMFVLVGYCGMTYWYNIKNNEYYLSSKHEHSIQWVANAQWFKSGKNKTLCQNIINQLFDSTRNFLCYHVKHVLILFWIFILILDYCDIFQFVIRICKSGGNNGNMTFKKSIQNKFSLLANGMRNRMQRTMMFQYSIVLLCFMMFSVSITFDYDNDYKVFPQNTYYISYVVVSMVAAFALITLLFNVMFINLKVCTKYYQVSPRCVQLLSVALMTISLTVILIPTAMAALQFALSWDIWMVMIDTVCLIKYNINYRHLIHDNNTNQLQTVISKNDNQDAHNCNDMKSKDSDQDMLKNKTLTQKATTIVTLTHSQGTRDRNSTDASTTGINTTTTGAARTIATLTQKSNNMHADDERKSDAESESLDLENDGKLVASTCTRQGLTNNRNHNHNQGIANSEITMSTSESIDLENNGRIIKSRSYSQHVQVLQTNTNIVHIENGIHNISNPLLNDTTQLTGTINTNDSNDNINANMTINTDNYNGMGNIEDDSDDNMSFDNNYNVFEINFGLSNQNMRIYIFTIFPALMAFSAGNYSIINSNRIKIHTYADFMLTIGSWIFGACSWTLCLFFAKYGFGYNKENYQNNKWKRISCAKFSFKVCNLICKYPCSKICPKYCDNYYTIMSSRNDSIPSNSARCNQCLRTFENNQGAICCKLCCYACDPCCCDVLYFAIFKYCCFFNRLISEHGEIDVGLQYKIKVVLSFCLIISSLMCMYAQPMLVYLFQRALIIVFDVFAQN